MLPADAMPIMVYFNDKGVVQYAVVGACGNPVAGDRVVPSAACQMLHSTQSATDPNTYTFTTDAALTNNATLSRVVYSFSDDGTTVTKSSLSEPVIHTFKGTGTVSVKVYATVPGGHEIETEVGNCNKTISFAEPLYSCVGLLSSVVDSQQRKYRFTAKTTNDAAAQLVSSDFAVDGVSTASGVTARDSNGYIYYDYTAPDTAPHAVAANVTFRTPQGDKVVSCQTSVTAVSTPMCTIPGKQDLPASSPNCNAVLPAVVRTVQVTPAPLPNTGPGQSIALSTLIGLIGAAGHYWFTAWRREKSRQTV